MPIADALARLEPRNRLLAALTATQFERIRPQLQAITLNKGDCLIAANAKIEHVYFPEDGMVSLVRHLQDGAVIEVGIIGAEGMVGTPILLGSDRSPIEAMVQMPGSAYQMPTQDLLQFIRGEPGFGDLLLRFVQTLFNQLSLTASCNGRHTTDQRLARWLSMAHDRADGDELQLSHEFISMMLGIRRAGVTVALAKLKQAGLLTSQAGRIVILDRWGLENTACECYAAHPALRSRPT